MAARITEPRLAAPLAYLAGSRPVSKRGLEEICTDVFDVPVSLGASTQFSHRPIFADQAGHSAEVAPVARQQDQAA
jgi:hypothetical protein